MKKVNFEPLTPVTFLERSASVFGSKTAVVYREQRHSYAQFQERVFRLANFLLETGIEPGDKVAFICPNTPPMLEAHFAVPMIGAALVPVNIRLSRQEVSYILDHCEARAVFCDNEFADVVDVSALAGVDIFVNICDVDDSTPLPGGEYEEVLQRASPAPVAPLLSDELDVITLNYTSGTTGRPKGVMYHHRGAYLNALGEMLETGINQHSAYLWTLPLFHCNGWCFGWGVTAMGATHVCLRKVDAAEIYRLVEAERVSHLCAAPTVLVGMANYAEQHGTTIQDRLHITTAGAPPAPTVIENMEALGVQILHAYGLTEVFGPHSVCPLQEDWAGLPGEELAKKKARQGVPMIIASYMSVVDPATMVPVPRDGKTVGEIVMRGNNVMLGYYKDDEATKQAFAGGWFHSGDLAVMHPDNYVQIVDRSKDVIISGGENISTVEVEAVLYKHPAVSEVAVVPMPHDDWGEVPKAFIALKPGQEATAEAIIAFCKESLARFKAPREVEFCDLPKTSTGKIQKFKLREREWQGYEKRVN